MGEEELQKGISAAYGIDPFKHYNTDQTAHFLSLHPSTVKRDRKRKIRLLNFIKLGPRKIRYRGDEIIKAIIMGSEWESTQNTPSNSENTTSPSEEKPGTDAGSRKDSNTAYRSAQQIFRKPSKS
jgi:hypothetical protein